MLANRNSALNQLGISQVVKHALADTNTSLAQGRAAMCAEHAAGTRCGYQVR
jgi:hypothetical protein